MSRQQRKNKSKTKAHWLALSVGLAAICTTVALRSLTKGPSKSSKDSKLQSSSEVFMSRQQRKNKFKTGVQWIALSAGLAAVCAGSFLAYFLVLNQPPDPVPVRLLTVKKGTIENKINEGGTVELREQRSIKSPKEGAVDRVLVRPGNRVRSGQLLLTLRYPEREIALANQEVQIQQEELNLLRLRQKIVEAQELLIDREQHLQRLSALALEGAVAQNQVQEQKDQARDARASLRDAQADTRKSALELRSLRLERQGIQQQLRDTIVTSPLDGVVLGVDVRDGDGVEVRTNLLTLGDPSQVLVKLQLSALNAAQVRVGQLVRVSAIGPSAKEFTGRVQSLYPQALSPEEKEKQGGGSGGGGGGQSQSDQPTVPATVQLDEVTALPRDWSPRIGDNPNRTLIPGSRVNVEIVLARRQNVVVLNTDAIDRSAPQPFVWVRNSQNQAQKRNVTLGLEGLMTVEAASGLRAGEQIILPPLESPLKPGVPVKVQGK